jgi:hypothetical protein
MRSTLTLPGKIKTKYMFLNSCVYTEFRNRLFLLSVNEDFEWLPEGNEQSHWSRIVLNVPVYKEIISCATGNHLESPQAVPNLHLQKDFYYLLGTVVEEAWLCYIIPLCSCTISFHMTFSLGRNKTVLQF